MVSFSTAVVVEVLGSVAKVDGDIVKQILPFVDSGLQSAVKGCLDQQVCEAESADIVNLIKFVSVCVIIVTFFFLGWCVDGCWHVGYQSHAK